MTSRRQFLAFAAATAGLAPVVAWIGSPVVANGRATSPNVFPVRRSEAEWRAVLTPEQFRILRDHRTEFAGSSPLIKEKRHGTFACAGCAQPLFASETKFESGTGWPSFTSPLAHAVGESLDRSWFMVRTEVHCSQCGGHLGHVFPDGPPPTGLRYCMNGAAMTFVPARA